MRLTLLPQDFTVCQVSSAAHVCLDEPFCFACRTDEELSLVCPTAKAPKDTVSREDGWRALRVAGPLDFALVGILARLSGALAAAGIPVFAVSTFNTDYLLVRSDTLCAALDALRKDGNEII